MEEAYDDQYAKKVGKYGPSAPKLPLFRAARRYTFLGVERVVRKTESIAKRLVSRRVYLWRAI